MPAKHAARARLFLPFDSLKGFREYLAEKEQPQESKKMLSEDDCERIDHLLRQLRPGDMAEVIWYAGGHHLPHRCHTAHAHHRQYHDSDPGHRGDPQRRMTVQRLVFLVRLRQR